MAIQDDWSIDYTNKRVYHSSGTTVYTVRQLYSFLQDTFDELVQMDDPVPMSAQTPTEFTMINGWFIDDESVKYLNGGAIATSGYLNEIQVLELDASGYVNCVAGDIGKQVQDDTVEVGALLAYDNDARKWWIRTGSGTAIADGSAMIITSGTGAGDAYGDSVDGEDLFANVYTLGTIESAPYPQVYIFQDGVALLEWSDLTNWDRGHIDVLIKVKEAGTEIAEAVITVFARQQGDLFDHFEIDLTNGGRNAVPLSTAKDLNNTKPDYYIFYDNGNGTDFQANEIITDDGGDWSAEVVSEIEWAAGIGVLGIRGLKGTISDGDDFTGATSGATGDVNGSGTGVLGTAYMHYDGWSSDFATGEVVTGGDSGAKRRILGIYEDVSDTSGYLLMDTNTGITGSNRSPYYKDFDDDENITSSSGDADVDGSTYNAISGFDDVTIAFVNGTATYTGGSGTFTLGERVTYSGGEAIVLYDSGSALTLGNVTNTSLNTKTITGDISGATRPMTQDLQSAHTMNKNFQQQSSYPYDVIVECGSIYNAGRSINDVYEYFKFVTEEDSTFAMYTVVSGTITILDGEEYEKAYDGYTLVKQAPFGSFAGGVYFGAQGVWVEGMASADAQSFQLIDSNGDTQSPPVSATMAVTGLVSGDRVTVFIRDNGSINKAQYNSDDSANAAGDTDFVIEEDIAQDTPATGKLRVVDDDGSTTFKEQRYRYSSWTSKTFSLYTNAGSGTITTEDTGGTTLIDSAADFRYSGNPTGVDQVEVGDVVRNATTGDSAIVVSVDSSTQLTTTKLEGGGDNQWGSSDSYAINVLDRAYDDGDTAYVPLIDEEATGTSVEETVLFASTRNILVRVRKKGIIPFEISDQFVQAGKSIAAIRTTDSIVL